jgi:hypothetical protein
VPLVRRRAHDLVCGEDEEHERRKSATAVSVCGRLQTEDEDGPDAGHDQRDCNGDALVAKAHSSVETSTKAVTVAIYLIMKALLRTKPATRERLNNANTGTRTVSRTHVCEGATAHLAMHEVLLERNDELERHCLECEPVRAERGAADVTRDEAHPGGLFRAVQEPCREEGSGAVYKVIARAEYRRRRCAHIRVGQGLVLQGIRDRIHRPCNVRGVLL